MEVCVKKDIYTFTSNTVDVKMSKKSNKDLANKNFGLTEEEFSQLIEELQCGRETIFERAFLNHFERSMNYIINKNGASNEEAYDVTMNTLLEFRKRLFQNKVAYGNINFLFTQMCSQRYLREAKRKIDFGTYEQVNETSELYDEETIMLLEKALSKMGTDCQNILQDVYYNKISYKELEIKYKKAAASLRKQKERCVSKLKMNLRQYLNTK